MIGWESLENNIRKFLFCIQGKFQIFFYIYSMKFLIDSRFEDIIRKCDFIFNFQIFLYSSFVSSPAIYKQLLTAVSTSIGLTSLQHQSIRGTKEYEITDGIQGNTTYDITVQVTYNGIYIENIDHVNCYIFVPGAFIHNKTVLAHFFIKYSILSTSLSYF